MNDASLAYEAPRILDTFDALEVMGSSEGLEVYTVGCGSQIHVITSCPLPA